MNQQMEEKFPKRVYHCPCLRMFVNDCFNRGEHSVADIDRHLMEYDHKNNLCCKKIFSKIVGEEMEHYLIICKTHLKTLLVIAEKKTCTSLEKIVFVDYTGEAFCLDCVRQYMSLLYFVFNSIQF